MGETRLGIRQDGAKSVARALKDILTVAKDIEGTFGKVGKASANATKEIKKQAEEARRAARIAEHAKKQQITATKKLEVMAGREDLAQRSHMRRLNEMRERASASKIDSERRERQRRERQEHKALFNEKLRNERELRREKKRTAKQQESTARAERRAQQRANRRRQRGFIRGGRSVMSAGLAMAGISAGYAASRFFGGATREAIRLDDAVTMLSIKESRASKANRGGVGVDKTQLRRQVQNTAIQYGMDPQDILEGMGGWVKRTGDLGAAQSSMGMMAKIAKATGTPMWDVGTMAAEIGDKFGIKDPAKLEEAMARLTVQGKRGAFELEDMARLFPRVLSAAKTAGVGSGLGGESNLDALTRLGGMLQITRSTTGTSQMAATALENLFADIGKKGGVIEKKYGEGTVFTDSSRRQMRDYEDVISDIMVGTGGDQTKLYQIFGKRSKRAVDSLIAKFNELKASGKSNLEAGAALNRMFRKAAEASGALAEVNSNASDAASTTSSNLKRAWGEVVAAASEQLAPRLRELSENMGGLVWLAKQAITLAGELGKSALGLKHIIDYKIGNKEDDTLAGRINRNSREFEDLRNKSVFRKEEKIMRGLGGRYTQEDFDGSPAIRARAEAVAKEQGVPVSDVMKLSSLRAERHQFRKIGAVSEDWLESSLKGGRFGTQPLPGPESFMRRAATSSAQILDQTRMYSFGQSMSPINAFHGISMDFNKPIEIDIPKVDNSKIQGAADEVAGAISAAAKKINKAGGGTVAPIGGGF